MLFLALPHIRPLPERLHRRRAAELVIAHEAAHEARARRRDAVVRVDVELRQCADVNFIFVLARDGGRQFFIEAVDSLDDDWLVFRDGKRRRSSGFY